MKYFTNVRPKPKMCTSETTNIGQFQHAAEKCVFSLVDFFSLSLHPNKTASVSISGLNTSERFTYDHKNKKTPHFLSTSESQVILGSIILTEKGVTIFFSGIILLLRMFEKNVFKLQ